MTDVHTKKQRSYNMSQIKSKNTKVELILRKYLFSKGFRNYRVKNKLPGKPDIIFPKKRITVFVDGCFWHKCPICFIEPQTNKEFWLNKINGNVKRDLKINNELDKLGWKVLRIWEHEVKDDLNKVYTKIHKYFL